MHTQRDETDRTIEMAVDGADRAHLLRGRGGFIVE